MSRFPLRDIHEIREELDRALASEPFIKKPDAASMFGYLVNRALEGAEEIREVEIGTAHLGRPNFDPTTDATVRKRMSDIRAALDEYNSSPTAARIWRIDAPRKKYLPTFTRTKEPTPPPPPKPDTGRKWKKPFIIVAVLAIGAVLAVSSIPSLHEGHCGRDITVTRPATGTVGTNAVVQGTSNPQSFWCWCKNYLVVEVASGPNAGARYNQGRIANAAHWSHRATFGERETPDGMLFNLFVLSTTRDLKPNFISGAVGSESVPISVVLKK